MSNTVLLKRSSTPSSAPLAANLSYGELAINYADGNLYYKNASDVVTVIASNQFSSVTGNITGGNLLTGGIVSATGNVQGGNLVLTTGKLTFGNVNAYTSNSAIQGWSYSNVSLSISGSEGTSTGLFFGNAGSSFYVVGTTNDKVFQYNMSSTNMANTGTVFGNVSVTTQDATPNDLFIDSTGANLYVLGQTNRVVYQYTMSTPWNITTGSYATLSANISAQEATPTGIWFKPDLSTMYLVGTTNDTVYQYTLSTPGNIATATYASKSYSVTSQEGTPTAVNLSSDGSKMWILGSAQTAIQEYSLGTPWDVSTASFTRGNSYSVRVQESSPQGMFVDIANAKVWIVGQTSDTVFQYNTANSIIATANAVGVQGQFQVQGNAYFADQTVFQGTVTTEGALTVDSTLTGAATVTFSTTTSTISIGTSQTTGATNVGGTAQTGNILIGQSTATQILNIGIGATSSANTKSINIAANGVANSTSNVTVFSGVAGNSNFTIGASTGNTTVSYTANSTVAIANTGGSALSVAGNITGGNILTAGLISATSTITSAANVVGGNLTTAGLVTATGNITGKYFLGNANIQYTASTAPTTGNLIGAQWYNTSTDALYEWQTDGTSSYWVDITGPTFGTNGAVTGSSITNGTSNVSVDLSGNVTITVAGVYNGVVISSGGNVSATGNITGANLIVNGLANITYAPATATGASIQASAANTQGGTGYADFLKATNASTGSTNPNKWFRIGSTGTLEIINSAYTGSLFSLTDAGVLSTGQLQVNGKKAVNGPAFRAYANDNQTITSGSQQKVTFTVENFDTDGCFASSTFTPTTEGYYQFNSTVRISGGSSTGEVMLILYKNGSEYARGTNESGTEQGASFYSMQVSDIAYANGSTDYFEIYIQQTSGSSKNVTSASTISYFSGVMVRGA